MSLREKQMAARRARILDAAGSLIRETGGTEFTMVTVADQAEVSHATPYNLFGSKNGLLYALLDRSLDEVMRGALRFTEPVLIDPLGPTLADLAGAAAARDVSTLVVIEANPVYEAPADLDMARVVGGIRDSVHVSLHQDETSAACRWFLPAAHYLEAWGDGRARDGTRSFIQPLVRPIANMTGNIDTGSPSAS